MIKKKLFKYVLIIGLIFFTTNIYSQHDIKPDKKSKALTWSLLQLVPSPIFASDANENNARIQLSFQWQFIPLNFSFNANKYVSPVQFFMISPVRRFTGSAEIFVQPEIATTSFNYSGFKSFADKTTIDLTNKITGVVGPNGSGKSNISDAIRWVLGEQSAKSLRGDKLEDVIFVGTESKKAMNYCEVAITLDNSDNKLDLGFSEITIKRRAYRTGESEFFINNKSCRLKDIQEIQLDTGIGKDGYSIVEQGKVDEILSNNPVNRRKVFDEACGISKFRYKKQEAERNLKHTKENLERIDDIYIEIENQLKPLFLQQEKAVCQQRENCQS